MLNIDIMINQLICYKTRLATLLLKLPALRGMNGSVTEELFFAGLIGNVQIDSIIPYILRMETAEYASGLGETADDSDQITVAERLQGTFDQENISPAYEQYREEMSEGKDTEDDEENSPSYHSKENSEDESTHITSNANSVKNVVKENVSTVTTVVHFER